MMVYYNVKTIYYLPTYSGFAFHTLSTKNLFPFSTLGEIWVNFWFYDFMINLRITHLCKHPFQPRLDVEKCSKFGVEMDQHQFQLFCFHNFLKK